MIISEFLKEGTNKKCRPRQLFIRCDSCPKEFQIDYTARNKLFEKYRNDLCRSCKQIEQYKSGERSKDQCFKGGQSARARMRGKTNKELYSEEKYLEIKEKIAVHSRGAQNNMFGKSDHTHGWINYGKSIKGKSLEDIHGNEKSQEIKSKLSKHSSGKNNPMYGKPAPMGAGNGWSGWYNEWYFRSLHELSYMINVIERFNFQWESAEKKDLQIKYKDGDNERTYVADFLIEGKYLVEIKPKKLHKSRIVKLKEKAAINFCFDRGLIYKLSSPVKLLDDEIIKDLIETDRIQLIDRYKEKYKQLKINTL